MSQLHDLAAKFPARVIHENPSGYGSYVSHHLYTQRLLMHLGGYDFELVQVLHGRVKDKDELGEVLVGVIARLTVEIDGRRVAVEEAGDCEAPGNWPHDGARAKDAMSDALKRCCARIGLGTHLYAKTADEYVLYRVLSDRALEEVTSSTAPVDPDAQVTYTEDDPGRPFDPPEAA